MAAERAAHQPPRARRIGSHQNADDLAREAVNCNAVLGRALGSVCGMGSIVNDRATHFGSR